MDERDYFGKPVRIVVPTKKGGTVVLEGTYDGYGEVEVEFGGKKETFYPDQFMEYWDCWSPHDQFVAHDIYCEDCMESHALTSRAEFDLSDFERVKDYMASHEKPAKCMGPMGRGPSGWGTAAPVAAPVAPAPVAAPVAPAAPAVALKKIPKPKALKKDDLIKQNAELTKKNAELTAQVEKQRLIVERFATLEEENKRLRENLRFAKERIEKARNALNNW